MSAATRAEIAQWLDKLYDDENLTHMVVVCDTYDFDDFPVYVSKAEDVREVVEKHQSENFSRVHEVYSRNHTKEAQLSEGRAHHYD